MTYRWRDLYVLFFVYRCAYSVIGELIIVRFTTLGDSDTFQLGSFDLLKIEHFARVVDINTPRIFGQLIAEFTGRTFNILFFGNPLLINIGFQAIAFVGLVYLLTALQPKLRLLMMLLLMLPSFSVWSSVAGKEALVVFAIGIIAGWIVRIFQGRGQLTLLYLFALLLIFLLKSHYLPAILFLLIGIYLGRRVRQRTFFLLVMLVTTGVILFLFRDIIAVLARTVSSNFWLGRSTRPSFFVETYDVFLKAPQGMFLSFFGPTISEASTTPLHLFSLVESALVLGVFSIFVVKRLPKLPVFMVVLSLGTIALMLFATYPFGVQNPGSAVRYRTGYEVLIFLAVVFLLSRETYVVWLRMPRREFRIKRLIGLNHSPERKP